MSYGAPAGLSLGSWLQYELHLRGAANYNTHSAKYDCNLSCTCEVLLIITHIECYKLLQYELHLRNVTKYNTPSAMYKVALVADAVVANVKKGEMTLGQA